MKSQTTKKNELNSQRCSCRKQDADPQDSEDLKSPELLGLQIFYLQDYITRLINSQKELAALEQATYA